MYKTSVCKICGSEFQPKSSRQYYCKQPIIKQCIVCGNDFETICSADSPKACSNPNCKLRAGQVASVKYASRKQKICTECGRSYTPTSTHQQQCNMPIDIKCQVCGKVFTTICKAHMSYCCSEQCVHAWAHIKSVEAQQQATKFCDWCGKPFHPVNNTQRYCTNTHYSNCVICGAKYEVDLSKQERPATCSPSCSLTYRFRNGNPFLDPIARAKAKATSLRKYGTEHPMQSAEVKSRVFASYYARTGYDHPAHNPDSRKGKARQVSKLEVYVQNALINNHIDFECEYMVAFEQLRHCFDIYLPKYKMLIDCDGVFYHGYLNDSNGSQYDEDRDQIRTTIVPEGWSYFVVVESNKTEDVKRILDAIHSIDSNSFNYEQYMFNWCRSISFPYPVYTESRLSADYKQLCDKEFLEYNPRVRYGMSTIRQYHKSIYSAHVGSAPSLYEAWYDDATLMKAIRNRMLYIDSVDPSKVLSGLYISKIAPKVSVFNPVLAKYLTVKYLSDVSTIGDPFSGFSGRLLGVCAAGKRYIGSDLNSSAVAEAQQIIHFHGLNASVELSEMHQSEAITHCDAMLTCPPYNKKEHYASETEYKTCDEWISICLERGKYNCRRFVFIVDKTERYANYIQESLITKSYFTNITEYVVVIDKEVNL